MNNILSFITGAISGVYISQNYQVPDIKKISIKITDYLKSLEK